MKPIHFVLVAAVLVLPLLVPDRDAWAGVGGEGASVCLVKKKEIVAAEDNRLHGTVAVAIRDTASGFADVVLRLEREGRRTNEIRFFRHEYNSTFTDMSLLALQNRLCEILSIPDLASEILAAFSLQGSRFVFTENGIRKSEVDVPVEQTFIPGTDGQRAATMADIVIFAQ